MCDDVVLKKPHLQQMPTPTDASTTVTETTYLTTKRIVRPKGSTGGASNAHNTLLSDALDECVIEIASLNCTAADQSHRLGKKCHVPPGSYEKAVAKVSKEYNLERSYISMETAFSRKNIRRKL
jgi:hypothetical protein